MFCQWTWYTHASLYDVETLWLIVVYYQPMLLGSIRFKVKFHKQENTEYRGGFGVLSLSIHRF